MEQEAPKFERPGKMVELRKTDIKIPTEYQRTIDEAFVRRIAGSFDWFRFKTLVVAYRNGEYYVVDGQHRLKAALLRPDVDFLPCMLYDFNGPEHEAIVFVLQREERRLNTEAIQRAEEFVGGEFGAKAIFARHFIESFDQGRLIPIATVRALWSRKREAFERIAPMLPDLIGDAVPRKDFLEGIVYLEDSLGPSASLTNDPDALHAIGYIRLRDRQAQWLHLRERATGKPSKEASPHRKAEALRWAISQGEANTLTLPQFDEAGEHIADQLREGNEED